MDESVCMEFFFYNKCWGNRYSCLWNKGRLENTIVADKFHVQRLVTWAFEDMRKKIQKSFHHDRRKYFKRARL
ncbi:MAG: transposase [Anaerovoracaceae bacterium]